MGDEFKDVSVDRVIGCPDCQVGSMCKNCGRVFFVPDTDCAKGSPLGDDWVDVGFTTGPGVNWFGPQPDVTADDLIATIKRAKVMMSPPPTISIAKGESEWFKQAINVDFKVEGIIDAGTVNLFTGGLLGIPVVEDAKVPTHSVMIETTDRVSGKPRFPEMAPLPSWWRWRKRRAAWREHNDNVMAWVAECAQWIRDGKPDREILVRRYLPNARISHGHQ